MIFVTTWKGLLSLLIIFLLQYIFPLSNHAAKNMLTFEMVQNVNQTKPEHILSITGVSSERIDTNLIILSISIQTLDISLSESYRTNTISSNKVSAILKEMKIPDRNVTTKYYYIQKQFKSIFIATNSTYVQVFEGYKVVNSLNIRLSDINRIPNLIDRLIQAGNVLINKIEFQLSRDIKKQVSDKLLSLAARDALERATVTADTLDLSITDIKTIFVRENLQISEDEIQTNGRGIRLKSGLARAASAPTIFSETSNIETRISVNFIIKK